MDYLEWCNQNGIQTCPIKVKIWTDAQGKTHKKFEDFASVKWFKEKKNTIKQRWTNYNNGNIDRYTHFAVDMDKIIIIDVDCVLNETNEYQAKILKLLIDYPFKISNTRS